MAALEDDEVVEAVGNVFCVTEHPGFAPVCLNRYVLWLSADKYKTRGGR